MMHANCDAGAETLTEALPRNSAEIEKITPANPMLPHWVAKVLPVFPV